MDPLVVKQAKMPLWSAEFEILAMDAWEDFCRNQLLLLISSDILYPYVTKRFPKLPIPKIRPKRREVRMECFQQMVIKQQHTLVYTITCE